MVRTRRRFLGIALAALAAAAAARAQEPAAEQPEAPMSVPSAGSANYTLAWVVCDAAVVDQAASAGYRIETTLGQTVIGVTSGPSGRAGLGFWYGLAHWLFSDGFESGDTSAWDSSVGG
jgi:hypothetical protein